MIPCDPGWLQRIPIIESAAMPPGKFAIIDGRVAYAHPVAWLEIQIACTIELSYAQRCTDARAGAVARTPRTDQARARGRGDVRRSASVGSSPRRGASVMRAGAGRGRSNTSPASATTRRSIPSTRPPVETNITSCMVGTMPRRNASSSFVTVTHTVTGSVTP